MANAKLDENSRPTLTALSNADDGTIVDLWADPTTHRLLVDLAAGAGTVTMVSVVSANGFYGTVADDTTTPAITLNTPITGIIKGTGTAMTAAVEGTDYVTASSTNTFTNKTYDTAGTGNSFSINGTAISAVTGTGAVVLATSPTLVTPALGAATATSINGLTITSSTGTLTITNGKTISFTQTLTLSGTDSTVMTFPSTSATIARTDAGQTFTGVNVFTSPKIITDISDTNGNEIIKFTATGSAVNEVTITNAATGTTGPLISATGESNVDLRLAAAGTGKIHDTTGRYGNITSYSPAASETATLTFNTSNIHTINMPAGNITIAFSNSVAGQCILINILQDSGGSRTVTWPGGIRWAGGSAPTLTTTANKYDTFGIAVAVGGTPYLGYVVGQNL